MSRSPPSQAKPPFRVRLPGFGAGKEVGLGEAVSAVARRAGFRRCGGCEARAATMNRWVTFTGVTFTGRRR